jgi:transcriptional regulator with XRE-family HTH domain
LNIGLRIRELRNAKNITAEQLADGTGLSRIYITKLENNPESAPSLPALENICNYLGYTLEEFFTLNLTPELKQLLDNAKGLSSDQIKPLIEFLKGVTVIKKTLPDGTQLEYAQAPGGRKLTEEEEMAIHEYLKNKQK